MKHVIAVLVLVLMAVPAQGAALNNCVVLMSGVDMTSTPSPGAWVPVSSKGEPFIAWLAATEDSGSATLDVKLQHSKDCTAGFAVDLIGRSQGATSFAQASATGVSTVKDRLDTGKCVRAVATITGVGQWDATVYLCGE